jgi:hypothetical protein
VTTELRPVPSSSAAGVPASFAPDLNVIDRKIAFNIAATPRDDRNCLDRDPQFGMSVRVTTPKPQDRAAVCLDNVTRFDFNRFARDAQNRAGSETQELALARG